MHGKLKDRSARQNEIQASLKVRASTHGVFFEGLRVYGFRRSGFRV